MTATTPISHVTNSGPAPVDPAALPDSIPAAQRAIGGAGMRMQRTNADPRLIGSVANAASKEETFFITLGTNKFRIKAHVPKGIDRETAKETWQQILLELEEQGRLPEPGEASHVHIDETGLTQDNQKHQDSALASLCEPYCKADNKALQAALNATPTSSPVNIEHTTNSCYLAVSMQALLNDPVLLKRVAKKTEFKDVITSFRKHQAQGTTVPADEVLKLRKALKIDEEQHDINEIFNKFQSGAISLPPEDLLPDDVDGTSERLELAFRYHENNLSTRPIMLQPTLHCTNGNYALHTVIIHKGADEKQGHYIALIQTKKGLYFCDDMAEPKVKKINENMTDYLDKLLAAKPCRAARAIYAKVPPVQPAAAPGPVAPTNPSPTPDVDASESDDDDGDFLSAIGDDEIDGESSTPPQQQVTPPIAPQPPAPVAAATAPSPANTDGLITSAVKWFFGWFSSKEDESPLARSFT